MAERITDAFLTAALIALGVLCWLAVILRPFQHEPRPEREDER